MKWTIAACQGPLGTWPEARPARAEWLASRFGGEPVALLQGLVEQDAGLLRAAREGETLVFWCESDCYDLADLAAAASFVMGVEPEARLELVLLDEHPEVVNFQGLVQLSPPQLVECFVGRSILRRPQVQALARCWDALRAGPSACDEIGRLPLALPYLAAAMERLGQEGRGADGLGLTERRLVSAARAEAGSAARLFRVVQSQERRPWLGDTMMFAMIDELASRADAPLRVAAPGAVRSAGEALVEAR